MASVWKPDGKRGTVLVLQGQAAWIAPWFSKFVLEFFGVSLRNTFQRRSKVEGL